MKILLLGAFGYRANKLDGQTIKTRNVYELVKAHEKSVVYYDTLEFKYSKWSLLKMFYWVCTAQTLLYLPAQNNIKYIFPFVFILAKLFRTKICYIQIGGWLNVFLQNKPIHAWMFSKLDDILAETKYMRSRLEEDYGFKNVSLFNNFRITDFKPTIHHEDEALKCVFMARVQKKKGLDMLFALADYIEANKLRITIDIFGQVSEEDKDYFFDHINLHPSMAYNGALQPTEIYTTIENYDVMLLPTHYFTEGLPGTILDAYISGIPVIATKWRHALEFIDNGQTGIVIPFEDGQDEFNKAVTYLLAHESVLREMKNKAYEKSLDFGYKKAWDVLSRVVN